MSYLPVLIGSFARKPKYLVLCDNVNKYKDIDIITDVCIKNKIPYKYNHLNVDQTIINPNDETSLSLIFNYCNNNIQNQKVVKILYAFEIIICPAYILYALKKSHIHRVIPYFSDNTENINIWYKNVNQYLNLREMCGIPYKTLDRIIYESQENDIEIIINKVFYKGFNEITELVGDTKVSLDVDKTTFFQDNIERFYDHDKLHILVAQKNRSSNEPLFLKYLKPDSVNLDKELFMEDTTNNHINMLREEIMVLLLERKMLPIVIGLHAKFKTPYNGYGEKRFKSDVKEIVANYATNLCGAGHSWLRNYVIDHLNFLMEYNLQMLEDIVQIVLQELQIELKSNNVTIEKLKFKPNIEGMKSVFYLLVKHNARSATNIQSDENTIYFKNINMKYYLPINTITNANMKNIFSNLIKDFNKNYTQTYVFTICNYHYVYNISIGCGICYDKKKNKWKQFVAKYDFNDKVSVECHYIVFNTETSNKICDKEHKASGVYKKNYVGSRDKLKCRHGVYYFSRGQYCGETNSVVCEHDENSYCYDENGEKVNFDGSNRMISYYGNLKKFMHILTEYISNAYLSIDKQHKMKEFKKLYKNNNKHSMY